MRRLLSVLFALMLLTPAAAMAQAKDWSKVAARAADGAFVQGNPAAKVKLVEYLSLTCPHCAHFEAEGVPPLTIKYIRTGLVSYEVRHILFNSFDLAASALARCNGPAFFFAVTPTAFAQQQQWMNQGIAWGKTAKLEGLPMDQALIRIAGGSGLTALFAKKGLTAAKANACLSNRAELEVLAALAKDAEQNRGITGTPTFWINGQVADAKGSWAGLEPLLKAALAAK